MAPGLWQVIGSLEQRVSKAESQLVEDRKERLDGAKESLEPFVRCPKHEIDKPNFTYCTRVHPLVNA